MRWLRTFIRLRGKINRVRGTPLNCEFNVPVYFNGYGAVELGDSIAFGYRLAPKIGNGRITIQARYAHSKISIGDRVEFSNNVTIISLEKVKIGCDCLIADLVSIMDSDFHDLSPNSRMSYKKRLYSDGLISPVTIEDNVWIGSRSIILKGVRIGRGAVIGAGSVVTNDIPENTLACGVPARVLRVLAEKDDTEVNKRKYRNPFCL